MGHNLRHPLLVRSRRLQLVVQQVRLSKYRYYKICVCVCDGDGAYVYVYVYVIVGYDFFFFALKFKLNAEFQSDMLNEECC